MKEKYKLILMIIGFLIIILLGSNIIGDVLYLTIKDKINKTLFFILHTILTFILIIALLKTSFGKYINNKLFKRK